MLEQMRSRLRAKKRFESAIEVIFDDVIALHGAEFGDLQLPVGDELLLVAQRGLSTRFLKAFERVKTTDGWACGQAVKSGEPIII